MGINAVKMHLARCIIIICFRAFTIPVSRKDMSFQVILILAGVRSNIAGPVGRIVNIHSTFSIVALTAGSASEGTRSLGTQPEFSLAYVIYVVSV